MPGIGLVYNTSWDPSGPKGISWEGNANVSTFVLPKEVTARLASRVILIQCTQLCNLQVYLGKLVCTHWQVCPTLHFLESGNDNEMHFLIAMPHVAITPQPVLHSSVGCDGTSLSHHELTYSLSL